MALYGPAAARLHEEIIPVTAAWTEAGRGTKPLRAFGAIREEATLNQLEEALRDPRRPSTQVTDRIRAWASADAADLEPELLRRAAARKIEVMQDLTERGEAEATSLRRLLEDQRTRIAKANDTPDDPQLSLFQDAELEQRRRDRRHWRAKLEAMAIEIEREPARVRESYTVRANRVEAVGLLYIWPGTN
jgi:hypothetical protein